MANNAQSLVVASRATLPLILSVPYDGGEPSGLLPVRKKRAVVRDAGTRDIAERVASILEARTDKRPYPVIALFSRKYLNANRSEQDAMESEDALPAYKACHEQIAAYISEVKATFPAGALLVDVHGQSDDPNTTFRGTRSGLMLQPVATYGSQRSEGIDAIQLAFAKNHRANERLAEDLAEA